MKLNEILRPCPFCGSEVELSLLNMERGGVTSIEVRCRCGAEVRFESDDFIYDNKGVAHQLGLTAIEKYNRRAEISYTAQCALDEYGRWITDTLDEQTERSIE